MRNEGLNTDNIVEKIGKFKLTTERYIKIVRGLNMIVFRSAAKTDGY